VEWDVQVRESGSTSVDQRVGPTSDRRLKEMAQNNLKRQNSFTLTVQGVVSPAAARECITTPIGDPAIHRHRGLAAR